ncbi:hypothetical protein ABZ540_33880 [Nocardia xishanensis]|uniref:hypothetical protein n=1 Tax=Nocardia xishanensis TaxID=238964 RepID=UPI0033F7EC11
MTMDGVKMQRGAPKSGWGNHKPVRLVFERTTQQQRPTPTGGNTDKKKPDRTLVVLCWMIGVIVLGCGLLGALVDSDSNDAGTLQATTTTSPPDPRTLPVFVGSVVAVSRTDITLQSGTRQLKVKWARLNHGGLCGRELYPAVEASLQAMVPIGALVTVVREPAGSTPAGLSEYGYIHVAEPGTQATMQPVGVSINEQIVAQGNSSIQPEIDRRDGAVPVAAQVEAARAEIPAEYLAAFDALVSANNAAWDGRLGALALCRDRLDREKADRIRWWGLDEKPGTDDDPSRHVPSISGDSSGNGGGGGESRFCRKRWWC